MKENSCSYPFSPIGEKARMRATHNATQALTPTLSQNWERGTTSIYLLACFLIICLIIPGGFFFYNRPCSNFHEATLQTPTQTLSLAMMETPEEQAKGLGGCTYIPKKSGMYFPMQSAREATFWMKDMLIPIDIVWIKDGTIVGVEKSVANEPKDTSDSDLTIYTSPGEIDAVLEVAAGKAGEYGLTEGSKITLKP